MVTVAAQGDYGKPRPALVIQSDFFDEHPSVTVLPLTSLISPECGLFRVDVAPDESNGPQKVSQVMIDKVVTFPREKVGNVIGRCDPQTLTLVDRALVVFLGLAD